MLVPYKIYQILVDFTEFVTYYCTMYIYPNIPQLLVIGGDLEKKVWCVFLIYCSKAIGV